MVKMLHSVILILESELQYILSAKSCYQGMKIHNKIL